MSIKSYEQTGLPQHNGLESSYNLAKSTMDGRPQPYEDYFESLLGAAQVAMAIPDASSEDKVRWCMLAYLSIASEFSGAKAQEIQTKIHEIVDGTPLAKTISIEANLDDPSTDISTLPNDVKALVAIGLVAGAEEWASPKFADRLPVIKDRFNRHAGGIHEGDIPASLYASMQESVAKINALAPV